MLCRVLTVSLILFLAVRSPMSAVAQARKPNEGSSIFDDDGSMPGKGKGKKPPKEQQTDANGKFPVPNDVARLKADKAVRTKHKADLDKGGNSVVKAALAKKILRTAGAAADPAEKYATLILARDLAREGFDPETGLSAIAGLDASFNLDALAMKRDLLTQNYPTAAVMLKVVYPVIDEAIAQDRFDIARELATSAVTAAKGANEKEAAYLKDVNAAEKAFKASKEAEAALAKTPDDAKANATVGKYRVFYKGDWDTGLPLLAKGNEADLKTLAAAELKPNPAAAAKVTNGDRVWDLAAAQTPIVKQNLQRRAAYWYRDALPELSGGDKSRIDRRLASLPAAPKPVAAAGGPDSGALDTPVGKWTKNDGGAMIVFTADGFLTVPRKTGKDGKASWKLVNGKVTFSFGGKNVELEFAGPDDLKDTAGSGWDMKRAQ